MIANLGKIKVPDGTSKEQILAALHSIVEKKPEKPSYTIEEYENFYNDLNRGVYRGREKET